MKIKIFFTTVTSIAILASSYLIFADNHAMKETSEMAEKAGEMAKDAGNAAVSAIKNVTNDASSALPNAKAGECYAKVIIPAEYKSESQTVTVKEASSKIEIIPSIVFPFS